MIKKIWAVLLLLCVSMGPVAWADTGSSGPGYFLSETAQILADIVLFPFRLVRDIFDPQPLPPRPVYVAAYPYAAPAVVAAPAVAQAPAPAAAPVVAPSKPTVSITRSR